MESYSKIGLNNDCKIDLQVFLVENIGRSRAKAMNYGIKKSRAYLFYFLGDDFIPNHDAIAEHLKFHDANIKITDVGIGMAFVPDNFKTDFVEWLENSARGGAPHRHCGPTNYQSCARSARWRVALGW